jgi:hypothetical protein
VSSATFRAQSPSPILLYRSLRWIPHRSQCSNNPRTLTLSSTLARPCSSLKSLTRRCSPRTGSPHLGSQHGQAHRGQASSWSSPCPGRQADRVSRARLSRLAPADRFPLAGISQTASSLLATTRSSAPPKQSPPWSVVSKIPPPRTDHSTASPRRSSGTSPRELAARFFLSALSSDG